MTVSSWPDAEEPGDEAGEGAPTTDFDMIDHSLASRKASTVTDQQAPLAIVKVPPKGVKPLAEHCLCM
jgi:hypothetical protein